MLFSLVRFSTDVFLIGFSPAMKKTSGKGLERHIISNMFLKMLCNQMQSDHLHRNHPSWKFRVCIRVRDMRRIPICECDSVSNHASILIIRTNWKEWNLPRNCEGGNEFSPRKSCFRVVIRITILTRIGIDTRSIYTSTEFPRVLNVFPFSPPMKIFIPISTLHVQWTKNKFREMMFILIFDGNSVYEYSSALLRISIPLSGVSLMFNNYDANWKAIDRIESFEQISCGSQQTLFKQTFW